MRRSPLPCERTVSGEYGPKPSVKVRISKFGQSLMKRWHSCVIRSSRILGNLAHFCSRAFEIWALELTLKISNVSRLGSWTRQSTNLVIKSSGADKKHNLTEKVLQSAAREPRSIGRSGNVRTGRRRQSPGSRPNRRTEHMGLNHKFPF